MATTFSTFTRLLDFIFLPSLASHKGSHHFSTSNRKSFQPQGLALTIARDDSSTFKMPWPSSSLRLGRRGSRRIQVVPELRLKLSDWLLPTSRVQAGDEHYCRNFFRSYSHGYNYDLETMSGSCKKRQSLLNSTTLTYDQDPF